MNIVDKEISRIITKTELDFLRGKEIFISGASGLIGGYFAQTMQKLKQNNDGPSRIFLSSKSGEFQFDVDPETEIIKGDLSQVNVLERLPDLDVIIHAAGYAQPGKFLENPLLTLALNTTSTIYLVRKIRAGGKFLFISSSEVYSGLNVTPFTEKQIGTTNTDHPRSPYIEGKRAGEAIVSASKAQKIDAKSVRLSLAYGPGTKLNDSRVMNSFIEQAITTSQISLKDSGQAMRTYCYVSDAIELCLNVLGKGSDDIYNVAGKSRIKICDLAKLISDITGAKLEIPENDLGGLIGAPDDVWLDISKSIALSPKSEFITMPAGVDNTIKWQKDNLFKLA
jgi:nucleoside-diphosphate-sugar epimerase